MCFKNHIDVIIIIIKKNHNSLVENDQKSMSNIIWCKNGVWGEGVVGYIMSKVYELKSLCLKGPRWPYWAPSIIPRGLSRSCQISCVSYGSLGITTSLKVVFNTSQISKVHSGEVRKSKGRVGGLILGCEIFSLLDGKTKSRPTAM
jgi:hypothetical protein